MGFLKRLLGSDDTSKPGKVRPVYDDTFEAEVLKSDVPVVVDFWATWCMPCQVMSGLMSELARENAGQICVLKMNVDQCRVTAQAFGIRSIPTILFFHNGKPVDQVVGLMPKNELAKKFEQMCRLGEESKTSTSASESP